jgi:hypothetical protein
LILFFPDAHNFFYYKGEKQYLELNMDYVFISTIGLDSSNMQLFNDLNIKFNKESLSSKIKQKLNSNEDLYLSELKLGNDISKDDYFTKVSFLKVRLKQRKHSASYRLMGS